MVYYRILNINPHAVQWDLIVTHRPTYNSLHLLIPNSPFLPRPTPSPLAATSLLSVSVSLFLFRKKVHLCHISDSTYK